MPELMRFGQVDKMSITAESWSGYHYGFNNPLRFSDPDGNESTSFTYNDGYGTMDSRNSTGSVGFSGSYQNNSFEDDKPKPKANTKSEASTAIPLSRGLGEVIKDGAGTVLRGAGTALKLGIRFLGIVGLIFTVEGDTRKKYETETFDVHNTDNETIKYHVPPRTLPGFPDATRVPSKNQRARWVTPDGKILEWDYQHGDVEVYNDRGKHQGSADPETGEPTKPAVKGRKTNK